MGACVEACVAEEKRAVVRLGRVVRSSSQNKFLLALPVDLVYRKLVWRTKIDEVKNARGVRVEEIGSIEECEML